MDNLNKWLDQVEKEIARQEALSEDESSLNNQINGMQHIVQDVDDHNRPGKSLEPIFVNLKNILVLFVKLDLLSFHEFLKI